MSTCSFVVIPFFVFHVQIFFIVGSVDDEILVSKYSFVEASLFEVGVCRFMIRGLLLFTISLKVFITTQDAICYHVNIPFIACI